MNSLRAALIAFALLSHVEIQALGAAQSAATIEMKVKTVAIDPNAQSPVVVLEAVGAKEYLPIWIDVPEARAISMELEQVKPPRPLTHDLIRNLLNGLGATVKRVTVTDLNNNTFFAAITLAQKGQESEIDARPSDAIAIALRMKAPIFVAMRVLEKSQSTAESAARADQAQLRLGIRVQELTAELAKLMDSQVSRGVIVTDVVSGAAVKAGIQRGDIVTKLNEQPVPTSAALQQIVQGLPASARVNLEVSRKGKPMTIVLDVP